MAHTKLRFYPTKHVLRRSLNLVFTSILELSPSKVWSDEFTPKNHPGILKRVFALFLHNWSDFISFSPYYSDFTPNESETAFRSERSDDFTPKVFSVYCSSLVCVNRDALDSMPIDI